MRISLFQPSKAVRENVIFKALAGPRETYLHQRGFDQYHHMVALRRSSPSTDVRLMSTQELEDYLIETLGLKRAPSASTSNRSFGGDVPQTMEVATSRPYDWIVVGKTLPDLPATVEETRVTATTVHTGPSMQVTIHVERPAKTKHSTFRPRWDENTRGRKESECQKPYSNTRKGVASSVTDTLAKMVPLPSDS
jgi:hypothetical protein